jgi:hypothetical protein
LVFSRQQLYLHAADLETLRREHRTQFPAAGELLANYQFGEYADRLWKELLGAGAVEVLDYSDYEGAGIVHDMNTPIPETLHQRFDAVIEAGSLEHIFNFPVAIRNLMLMTKVGGSVFLTTLANNFCGHGFYQFSPEVMYRIFDPENGFEKPNIVLLEAGSPWVEMTPLRSAHVVMDPSVVRSRIGLQSKRPVMMMVQAKRISAIAPFRTTPQQSDYVSAWTGGAAAASGESSGTVFKSILDALPISWKNRVLAAQYSWQYSFRNGRFYQKVPL